MAISYTNFLAQVRNYTEVDSNVLTDSLLDQFIRQTELEIAGQVDYDDLRKYSTSNYITGQRYLSLPSDNLILRSVQNIVSGQRTFLQKKQVSLNILLIGMILQSLLLQPQIQHTRYRLITSLIHLILPLLTTLSSLNIKMDYYCMVY